MWRYRDGAGKYLRDLDPLGGHVAADLSRHNNGNHRGDAEKSRLPFHWRPEAGFRVRRDDENGPRPVAVEADRPRPDFSGRAIRYGGKFFDLARESWAHKPVLGMSRAGASFGLQAGDGSAGGYIAQIGAAYENVKMGVGILGRRRLYPSRFFADPVHLNEGGGWCGFHAGRCGRNARRRIPDCISDGKMSRFWSRTLFHGTLEIGL